MWRRENAGGKELKSTNMSVAILFMIVVTLFYFGALNMIDKGFYIGAIALALGASFFASVSISMLHLPRKVIPFVAVVMIALSLITVSGLLFHYSNEITQKTVCNLSENLNPGQLLEDKISIHTST